MTGKERVLAALRHEQPDRVPFFEYVADYDIMQQILGREVFLRGHFKEARALWEGRRDELVEGYKRDLIDFTRATGADGLMVSMVPPRGFMPEPLQQLDEENWRDWVGNLYRYSPLTEDLGLIAVGALDPQSPPPDLWEPPAEPDPSEFELIDFAVRELGATHFLMSRRGRRLSIGYISGLYMEAHLLSFIERPDQLREDRLAASEAALAEFEMLLSHGVESVMLEEDFGCTSGPMMSPRTFRDVILPGLTRLCANLKSFGAPAFFHSCGVNWPLIEMFIDAGIDMYQAIQPEEDIVGLKRDYGDRLGLWGGISTDGLVRWTPEQMKADVARIVEACKPNGGFILGASHSVTVRARADNYLAAIDALNEHGWR
jgi:hypothetical protein